MNDKKALIIFGSEGSGKTIRAKKEAKKSVHF
jgi:adenylate kinase family enzyme